MYDWRGWLSVDCSVHRWACRGSNTRRLLVHVRKLQQVGLAKRAPNHLHATEGSP